MKIDRIIQELETLKEIHGNIEATASGSVEPDGRMTYQVNVGEDRQRCVKLWF